MSCTAICQKFRAKFNAHNGGHYGQGHKKCEHCGVFMVVETNRCPCCKKKLRLRKRKRDS